MFSVRAAPDLWRPYFDLLDETAAAGGRMFAQVHSRFVSCCLTTHRSITGNIGQSQTTAAGRAGRETARPGDKAKLVEIAVVSTPDREWSE